MFKLFQAICKRIFTFDIMFPLVIIIFLGGVIFAGIEANRVSENRTRECQEQGMVVVKYNYISYCAKLESLTKTKTD